MIKVLDVVKGKGDDDDVEIILNVNFLDVV